MALFNPIFVAIVHRTLGRYKPEVTVVSASIRDQVLTLSLRLNSGVLGKLITALRRWVCSTAISKIGCLVYSP